MYQESVNANVCKIERRTADGNNEIVGSGCLIQIVGSNQETILKIATSKDFISDIDKQFFAVFENPSGGTPLKFKLENEEQCYTKVAYFPFDKSSPFPPEGIRTRQSGIDAEPDSYRVLVRSSQLQHSSIECLLLEVLECDHRCCLKRSETPTPEQGKLIYDLEASKRFHLALAGSPVLTFPKPEFVGIVDIFCNDQRPYLYFHGQQGQKKKFSQYEPLKNLWECISFRDEFCRIMDIKYKSGIQSWANLADKFAVPSAMYESFSDSETSPSEKMLDFLEVRQPYLKLKDYVEACRKANVNEIADFLESKAIGATTFMNDLWDKDHEVVTKMLLMLDRKESWKNVAPKLNIPRNEYEKFKTSADSNKARDLFDILKAESPRLTVKDLKDILKKVGGENIIKIMDDYNVNISDETLLRNISSQADLKLHIEQKLNKGELLYKLAQEFQNQGHLKGRSIEVMFRQMNSTDGPTHQLMDYVIMTHPEGKAPTIKDLLVHLQEINRLTDLKFVEEYLRGGSKEFDDICKELSGLLAPSAGKTEKRASGDDERGPVQEESQ